MLDFLDALHSLGFLEREGVGAAAKYANTRETEAFLVRGKPRYIGGFLNMLIEAEGGFNFTQAEFEGWCREAGFRGVRFEPLAGPTSAAIALK
jgi:hypothetical protein